MDDQKTPAGLVRPNDGLGAWQPIETAPRDGTEVLVCRVYEGGKAEYAVAHNYDDGNGWRDMGDMGWAGMTHDDENQPTHWMPLPAHPEAHNAELKGRPLADAQD